MSVMVEAVIYSADVAQVVLRVYKLTTTKPVTMGHGTFDGPLYTRSATTTPVVHEVLHKPSATDSAGSYDQLTDPYSVVFRIYWYLEFIKAEKAWEAAC